MKYTPLNVYYLTSLAVFSQALSNFILKHTTKVHDISYQSVNIREDLAQAAFNQRAGTDIQLLFATLRNLYLTRDPNAPIKAIEEGKAEFKLRGDYKLLRSAIANAKKEGRSEFQGTLESRLKYLRLTFNQLKFDAERSEYFRIADAARAQGRQPPPSAPRFSRSVAASLAAKSRLPLAEQLSLHFKRKWNCSKEDDPGRYILLVLAYLKNTPKHNLEVWEEELN